jgi:hypothetical protein
MNIYYTLMNIYYTFDEHILYFDEHILYVDEHILYFDEHITEILLKMVLNTIALPLTLCIFYISKMFLYKNARMTSILKNYCIYFRDGISMEFLLV